LSDRTPDPSDAQPSLFREEPEPAVAPVEPPARSDSLADGLERSLDPKSVTVQRIVGGVTAVIFAGLLLIGLAVVSLTSRPGFPVVVSLFLVWITVAAGLGAWAMFWPAVRYRHTFFRLDPLGLRIRRGVVWRSVTSIPRSRVQHTDVSQGPIERWADLATLIVHTAGTEHASVSLAGLPKRTAYRIRDFLIESNEPDAV
jgi:membrane protein YdbS with pleckstrin-like domain